MLTDDNKKTTLKSLSSDSNEKTPSSLMKRGYSSMIHLKEQTSDYGFSLTDAYAFKQDTVKLPIASFNHIAREVFSLEKSRHFYVDILGFQVIPRPMVKTTNIFIFQLFYFPSIEINTNN
jgi:hypothetical protein